MNQIPVNSVTQQAFIRFRYCTWEMGFNFSANQARKRSAPSSSTAATAPKCLAIFRSSALYRANTENYFNQQVQQLPVATRYYTDIQRQLSVVTESLNRFLQTREQLQVQVQAAQKEVPWQLIAPHKSPKRRSLPPPGRSSSAGLQAYF